MTEAAARILAQVALNAADSDAVPLRLAETCAVADVGWGFVYPWNTARWFDTRADADAIGPGLGPLVVTKERQEAFFLLSAPSVDEQLASYALACGLPAPPELGW